MKTQKMTKEQAKKRLYDMWRRGELPSHFTEDHSQYEEAVEHLLVYGWYSYMPSNSPF